MSCTEIIHSGRAPYVFLSVILIAIVIASIVIDIDGLLKGENMFNNVSNMIDEEIIDRMLQGHIGCEEILNMGHANRIVLFVKNYPFPMSMARAILENIGSEKITSEVIAAIVSNHKTTLDTLWLIWECEHEKTNNTKVIQAIATNPNISLELLNLILEKEYATKEARNEVFLAVASNPNVDPEILNLILKKEYSFEEKCRIFLAVASNDQATPDMLLYILTKINEQQIYKHNKIVYFKILAAIADSKKINSEVITSLLQNKINFQVLKAIASNIKTPADVHKLICADVLSGAFKFSISQQANMSTIDLLLEEQLSAADDFQESSDEPGILKLNLEEQWSNENRLAVLIAIAGNIGINSATILFMLRVEWFAKITPEVLIAIASNPNVDLNIIRFMLDKWSAKITPEVLIAVVSNPSVDLDIIKSILLDTYQLSTKRTPEVLRAMISNTNVIFSEEVLRLILKRDQQGDSVITLEDLVSNHRITLLDNFQTQRYYDDIFNLIKLRSNKFEAIASHPQLPLDVLNMVLDGKDNIEPKRFARILVAIISNPQANSYTLKRIYKMQVADGANNADNAMIIAAIAGNPKTDPEILVSIIKSIGLKNKKVTWKALAALVANPNCDDSVLDAIKEKIINYPDDNEKRFIVGDPKPRDRFKFFASILNPMQLASLVEKLLQYCGADNKRIARVFGDHPIRDLREALDGRDETKSHIVSLINLYQSNELLAEKIKETNEMNKSELFAMINSASLHNLAKRAEVSQRRGIAGMESKTQRMAKNMEHNLENAEAGHGGFKSSLQ